MTQQGTAPAGRSFGRRPVGRTAVLAVAAAAMGLALAGALLRRLLDDLNRALDRIIA